jgi:carbonic anhydrase
MRNDRSTQHSCPDHPAGAPTFDRRTMLLGAGCVGLGTLFVGGAGASASAFTARGRSAGATLTSQSPIDLRRDEITFVDSLPTIAFAYPRSVDVTLVNTGSPDEEKTVRADVPVGAAHLDLSGERWELDQFHWHTPSEHEREGRDTPMEMHLVHHRADGTAAGGPFLVIGVFLERGHENRVLDPIFRSLRRVDEPDETRVVRDVHLKALLPHRRQSFRYSGSLTTPPFTEPVAWVVLAEALTVSNHQIGAFRALFPDGNSREVQPLNDREVLSDSRARRAGGTSP